MSSDAGGDGWEGRQWDDMVERCAAVVDRLRTNNDIRRADDEDDRGAAELTRALEEIVALIADDEEYVPALGAARGHDLLARLVTHRVPEVASAAADAMEACARHCPPGASFPARGDVDEPSHAIMRVGTLAAPLTLRMRHVREGYGGGERRRIPNIAWDSGLVLARWISRHPELVAGKSVLEIGAGLGAPSMAAARRGASTVALTDADPLATRNAAYNARMNLGRVASAKVACVVHDWNDESDLSDTDSDDSDETNHGTDRGRATCSLGRALERFGGFRRSDEEGGGDWANGGGANERWKHLVARLKRLVGSRRSTSSSARTSCTSAAWPRAWPGCWEGTWDVRRTPSRSSSTPRPRTGRARRIFRRRWSRTGWRLRRRG